jgi:hypothetical protein
MYSPIFPTSGGPSVGIVRSRNQTTEFSFFFFSLILVLTVRDRLCGLVVRVLDYRSGGPGTIPGTTRFSEKKKKNSVS